MLALICGSGDLPAAVAEALPDRPLVCALEPFRPEGLDADIVFRIETLGSLLADLQARGVTRVCLIGHIHRPEVALARIDDATMPLVPRLREALQLGDDGALRVVLSVFEEAGLSPVAAHAAAPALLPAPGVPTAVQPPETVGREASLGDAALAEMAAADLGQACIVRNGAVVLREDERGTDALLARFAQGQGGDASDPVSWFMDGADALLGNAAEWLSGGDGRSGFLFKAPKPGQDRRADLPVIGPQTVSGVARAGLSGIVIEAGGVMVAHRARVVAACDRAGLFLWIRQRP